MTQPSNKEVKVHESAKGTITKNKVQLLMGGTLRLGACGSTKTKIYDPT
jgi:glutaredoxin-related protein